MSQTLKGSCLEIKTGYGCSSDWKGQGGSGSRAVKQSPKNGQTQGTGMGCTARKRGKKTPSKSDEADLDFLPETFVNCCENGCFFPLVPPPFPLTEYQQSYVQHTHPCCPNGPKFWYPPRPPNSLCRNSVNQSLEAASDPMPSCTEGDLQLRAVQANLNALNAPFSQTFNAKALALLRGQEYTP